MLKMSLLLKKGKQLGRIKPGFSRKSLKSLFTALLHRFTKNPQSLRSLNKFDIGLALVFSFISISLMWKTFSINSAGNLVVADKAWSDFSAAIPLIRSFSFGDNLPPQYPLFAGPPIHYHFIFFALVGLLEKIGIRLDWALNCLSAISFFVLLWLVYTLPKTIFKKRSIGLISVILFLFNSSLSFLEFFKTHRLNTATLVEIVKNQNFASFGPYDGKIVSAFWNLNIYTNQRHLAISYAAFLFLILIFYNSVQENRNLQPEDELRSDMSSFRGKPRPLALAGDHKFAKKPKLLTNKKILLIALFVGLFPFVHLAVFSMLGIALVLMLFLYPKLSKKILFIGSLALLIAIPQILYMGNSGLGKNLIRPGYLAASTSFSDLTRYWFYNLGLTAFTAPIGFILAGRRERKVFIPFFALFIVGNIFRFSPEIAANHKFFNLFIIGANFFSAYFIYMLWTKGKKLKLFAPIIFFFLIFSGIIDIFPIVNDVDGNIKDYKNNPTAFFILKNTPKNSVFLNESFLYDPASLAGRKIYLGWPYFSWSAGYDTTARFNKMKLMLSPKNKRGVCDQLQKEGIDYIEIKNPTELEDVVINYSFFANNFREVFADPTSSIVIYDVAKSCHE